MLHSIPYFFGGVGACFTNDMESDRMSFNSRSAHGSIGNRGDLNDVYISVVFFSLCIFGMVLRGGLCRCAAETVCQPGLFKRPPVSHLRFGRGWDGFSVAALFREFGHVVGGLHAVGVRTGIPGRFLTGEAVSSKMVGLFRLSPQPSRVYLSEIQCAVGCGRSRSGAVFDALEP